MQIKGSVDARALLAAIEQIGGRQTQAAISAALNRGGSAMRTKASKLVREDFRVKAKDLKADTLRLDKARGEKTSTELHVRGNRIPLIDFSNAAQSVRGRGTLVGIRVGAKRQLFRGAFVTTIKKGPSVFWRKMEGGKRVGRGPVESLTGPSVTQMLHSPKRTAIVLKAGMDTFVARFKHEFDRRLARKQQRR